MLRKSQSSAALFVFLSLLLVGLIIATFLIENGADAAVIICCLTIFYGLLWRPLVVPINIRPEIRTFVSIELLFLLFSFMIFFAPYQLYLLGRLNLEVSRFVPHTFAEKSNQAILLSTAGMVAFCLGCRWRAYFPRRTQPAPHGPEDRSSLLPYLVLFLLTGLMALYHLAGWRAEGEGRYTGTAAGGVMADGVSLLITMLSMMAFAMLIVRKQRSERAILPELCAAILAGFWTCRLVSFGDRNSALLLLFVLFAGVATFRCTISRLLLLAIALFGLQVYDRIEAYRMTGDWAAGHLLSFGHNVGETSFNITTISVRAALATVHHAGELGLGFYKVFGFAGVVPFVRGLIIGEHEVTVTSADVLTAAMLPPHAGWNVGSNIIADIYLDFGIIGVPIVLYLLGRFAGWIQRRAAAQPFSTHRAVLYLMTVALFAELPRYAVDFPVRYLVWAVLVMILARWMSPPVSIVHVPRDERVSC
ncbi:O-antigen polysaccharide polymerase Wzy [Aquamicrobium zhengzhouense]|uniref:O-antigen polysaccharide polymerase Wzy n=1 Tax=Aquamicrobium zhengzhouense TaxID=2781738 RepID=A0ABS0S7L9_9HYPH|nr:O-antigen polysaccharide polymerase Wzy [Aquamicrobium zhengzhouense]MBI1619216.1 O-antigen polysaccharide polymerase Wzy [Aquamicrobium zhengzhouense]